MLGDARDVLEMYGQSRPSGTLSGNEMDERRGTLAMHGISRRQHMRTICASERYAQASQDLRNALAYSRLVSLPGLLAITQSHLNRLISHQDLPDPPLDCRRPIVRKICDVGWWEMRAGV